MLHFYSFPSRASRDSIAPEVRPKCAQRSFRFMPPSNKRHSSSSSSSVQGFPLFSGSVFFCLRDSFSTAQCSACTISPLLHTWSSGSTSPVRGSLKSFQTARPVWGATFRTMRQLVVRAISIHARTELHLDAISIHAPHAGRDHRRNHHRVHRSQHFNPRTPCGVRLAAVTTRQSPCMPFQSTRPVRGATLSYLQ